MGTSRSAAGPKSPAWTKAKAAATAYANDRPGSSPRKVIRRTAEAMGGGPGTGGGSWSPGSKRAAQRLAGLLVGAIDDGLIESAHTFGIGDLEGMPTGEAILEILEWIAEDAVDLDQQVARRSVEEVLSNLDRDGVDLDQPMDTATGTDIFRGFVVEYVTRSILMPVTPRLVENAAAPKSREKERDIARYVEALVEVDIPAERFAEIDWLGVEGAGVLDQIHNDALDALADGET